MRARHWDHGKGEGTRSTCCPFSHIPPRSTTTLNLETAHWARGKESVGAGVL